METGILEVLLVNAKGIRHTNIVGILPLISLYIFDRMLIIIYID